MIRASRSVAKILLEIQFLSLTHTPSVFSFTQIIHHANLAAWRKPTVVDNEGVTMTALTIMQGSQITFKRLGDHPGFTEIGRTYLAVRPTFATMVGECFAKKIPGKNNGGYIHFNPDVDLTGTSINGCK